MLTVPDGSAASPESEASDGSLDSAGTVASSPGRRRFDVSAVEESSAKPPRYYCHRHKQHERFILWDQRRMCDGNKVSCGHKLDSQLAIVCFVKPNYLNELAVEIGPHQDVSIRCVCAQSNRDTIGKPTRTSSKTMRGVRPTPLSSKRNRQKKTTIELKE